MARKRRGFSPFSLAFLDIMSCGFGAVVLLFLIIKHHADVAEVMPEFDLNIEIDMLTEETGDARDKVADAAGRAALLDQQIAAAQGQAERIRQDLAAARGAAESVAATATSRDIEALKAQLKRLENDKKKLQTQIHEKSRQVRTITGEGNREYLTGLKMGGQRILVLLDVSASMLDDTIVNVIRRRNMDDAAKRRSWKWRQALATVGWISARFPPTSQYQIFAFDTRAKSVASGSNGKWLKVSDYAGLERTIGEMNQLIPAGGSSLARGLEVINQMSPRPDNVYLITDGLPTQGLTAPRRTTVSGRERLRFFEDALRQLPPGVPVNVILLPMEGDPMAAWAFWQIALSTRGAFLTPARDWP